MSREDLIKAFLALPPEEQQKIRDAAPPRKRIQHRRRAVLKDRKKLQKGLGGAAYRG